MIVLNNITKKYGTTTSVDNVSLHIKKGEFFGLLGPNGAGKTTTVRMLMALTAPTAGSITINGILVDRNNTEYKEQIGLVPQHTNLEPELTVVENLKLHAMLYKIDKLEAQTRIKDILAFTDLVDKKDAAVQTLSGGMKRKLLIARALMHNPSVLILDEPTVGLDVFARRKVWDLIKGLYSRGLTIILTTHYLEEAEALCTRVGLLKKGRIIMTGSLMELKEVVGQVVLEQFENDKTKLYFYKSKSEALAAAVGLGENINIRQTRLEDIFVKLTEEREQN